MRTSAGGRVVVRKLVLWAGLAGCAQALLCVSASGQVLKMPDAGAPQKLMIAILDGDGALNNIRQRDAREPIVQVTDENHKPVAGALVLFTIHSGAGGAGATFDGAQTLTVRTGQDGIAHASGLQLAKSPGSFTISVSASVAVAAGVVVVASEALIHQSNIIGALTTSTASSSAGSASSASSSSASGTAGSGTAGSGTATHSGLGHLLHLGNLGHTGTIVVVSAAVATAVVVTVVVVTQNNSTSLTLGSSTVGHP
jgi:hypothetical protein